MSTVLRDRWKSEFEEQVTFLGTFFRKLRQKRRDDITTERYNIITVTTMFINLALFHSGSLSLCRKRKSRVTTTTFDPKPCPHITMTTFPAVARTTFSVTSTTFENTDEDDIRDRRPRKRRPAAWPMSSWISSRPLPAAGSTFHPAPWRSDLPLQQKRK